MAENNNDSFDENFINSISKDLEFEDNNKNVTYMDSSVDDDGLDSHIQNSALSVNGSTPLSDYDCIDPRQNLTEREKAEIDARSIYVGNVDYGTTAVELEQHFKSCGAINRITILTDRFSGHPKGFAYVEFDSSEAVDTAQIYDDSEFRGRKLKVNPKRTNIVGISTTNRNPRRRISNRAIHKMFRGMPSYNSRGGRFPRRTFRHTPY